MYRRSLLPQEKNRDFDFDFFLREEGTSVHRLKELGRFM